MVKNNKRKKAGTSRSKKFKSGGPIKSGIAKGCGKVMNDRRKVTKHF